MNLIEKFGYASGANTMNQVIIDGMKMSPDNPTFLDGRDAILDADLATNGGVNSCLIWDAFARMGMGVSALTTDKNDITPPEAFDVPTACAPVSQVNAPSDFGEVCEGDFSTLTLTVFNTGSGDLILYGVERTDGSDDITVDSQPETPVFVSADAHVDFTVRCSPTTGGTKTATITVESNDTANPTRDIVYTCDSGQATLDTVYDGSYGNVCLGDKLTQELRILNEGACVFEVDDITISNVGDNDFNLATVMSFPFTVAPGGEITVPIEFEPVGDTDPESATIRIYHDADSPPSPKTLSANGHSEDAVVNTLIANAGSFGEVCAGDFWDLDLAVNNDGTCPLEIDSATIVLGANAQGGDFSTPAGNAAGTIVEPGNSVQLPIRFSPSAFDNDPPLERLGTVELDSHTHLASPSTLPTDSTPISGAVPPPDINVAIANSGDFGNVCKGDHADLNLTLFNQGKCDLTITDIKIMGADADSFELPSIPPLQLPLVLSPDADFNLPIRYAPDECTDIPETATIVITSDDPDDDPVNIPISGTSPCPNLVIDPVALTALYSFPPTVVDTQGTLGCFSEQNVVLRNESECPLTITDISAEGTLNSLDFGVTAPTEFPIFLPGGEETLDVTVRFTPQSDDNPLAPSELVGALTVVSDDPDDIPVGERMADLCGESAAQSGVRILVTDISSGTDVPVDEVDSITIQSKGKNRPGPINLMFTDRPLVPDAMVCGNLVLYHVDQETLPSTATTGSNPKSSYQNKAMEGNLQTTENYSLNQCEFRESQLQLQDSDSEDCLLAPKGADCTTDGECCSGKCKGPSGAKTCK